MAEKSGDAKKVMDVSTKSSAPSETSRPVIVSNRRIVQDPMMKPEKTDSAESSDDPEKKPPAMASTGKTLQPLGEQSDAKEDASEAVDDKVTEPESDKSDTSADSIAEEAKPTDTSEADDADAEEKKAKEEAAIVDAVANQAGGKKKTEDEIKTDSAKQEAIKKLIEEKKYFLPIGEITKRKQNKQVIFTVAFLVLVVVGGYLALDMELVDSPVKLPFRIFK